LLYFAGVPTGLLAEIGLWTPLVLNALFSAGLLGLYAYHTQTPQGGVYALLVGMSVFLLAAPRWYSTPAWRWMKYLVVLLPPWVLMASAFMILQEETFRKMDLFFIVAGFTFLTMFNSFSHILLSRVRNESLDFETFLVAIGAFTPALLIGMWLKLNNEDPNQWPSSNYYAFHLAIIMVAMVLTSIVWTVSIKRLKEAERGEEGKKDTK
jgi:hypothetical protein